MTTLHILSSPHTPVHINNRIDPFSISTLKFINHMTQYGWDCIHYGIPGSEVSCELVNCLPVKSNNSAVNITEYNNLAGKEITSRKKPGDMVICMYGIENKGAAEANNDLKIIEPGIGYTMTAVFAMYKVFTSYAQMHMYYEWPAMNRIRDGLMLLFQTVLLPASLITQRKREITFYILEE